MPETTTLALGKRSPASLLDAPTRALSFDVATSSLVHDRTTTPILQPLYPSPAMAAAAAAAGTSFLPKPSSSSALLAASPPTQSVLANNSSPNTPSMHAPSPATPTPTHTPSTTPRAASSPFLPLPTAPSSSASPSSPENDPHTRDTTRYLGFLPASIYLPLSPANTDWRTRSTAVELLHRCIIDLQPSPPTFLRPHLPAFLEFMGRLLHDPNFKVVLTALFALTDLLAKFDPALMHAALLPLMALLLLKLEDSKMILRQAIFKLVAQITQVVTPPPILAIVTHYLASNQPRVKEQVANLVIALLLLFPTCPLDLANIVADLLVALVDPNPRIKYVAVEAYSVLAARYGAEKILALLKSYGLEEDTLTALRVRFTNPMLPVLTPDGMVDHIIHLRSSSSSTSSSSSSTTSGNTALRFPAAPPPTAIASLFSATLTLPRAAAPPAPVPAAPAQHPPLAAPNDRSTPPAGPSAPAAAPATYRGPAQKRSALPTPGAHTSATPTATSPLKYHAPAPAASAAAATGSGPADSAPSSTHFYLKPEPPSLSPLDLRATQSIKSAPTVTSRSLPTYPSPLPAPWTSKPDARATTGAHPAVSPPPPTVSPPRRPKPVEDPKNLVVQLNTGDWELQQKALDTLQAHLPAQKHVFLPVLGELTMAVLGQVTNLRSGVARPAITTLAQLLLHCGRDMDPNLAEPVLTCLLRKYSDPKEFLTDSVDRALAHFVAVHWPPARVLPVLLSWAMHKHAGIRLKTAALLRECLGQMPEPQLARLAASTVEQTRMVPVLLALVRDGNKETRAQAKLALGLLNKVPEWPHVMEKLVNGSQLLDIRKALQS